MQRPHRPPPRLRPQRPRPNPLPPLPATLQPPRQPPPPPQLLPHPNLAPRHPPHRRRRLHQPRHLPQRLLHPIIARVQVRRAQPRQRQDRLVGLPEFFLRPRQLLHRIKLIQDRKPAPHVMRHLLLRAPLPHVHRQRRQQPREIPLKLRRQFHHPRKRRHRRRAIPKLFALQSPDQQNQPPSPLAQFAPLQIP